MKSQIISFSLLLISTAAHQLHGSQAEVKLQAEQHQTSAAHNSYNYIIQQVLKTDFTGETADVERKKLRSLYHVNQCNSLSWSPDGKHVACVINQTLVVIDVARNKSIHSDPFDNPRDYRGDCADNGIHALKWTSNDTIEFIISSRYWIEAYECISYFQHTRNVIDGTMTTRKLSHEEFKKIDASERRAEGTFQSNDKKKAAYIPANKDKLLLFPSCTELTADHNVYFQSAVFSPDGSKIAIQQADKLSGERTISLWDLQKKILFYTILQKHSNHFQWSPDGTCLAVSTQYNYAKSHHFQVPDVTFYPVDDALLDLTNAQAQLVEKIITTRCLPVANADKEIYEGLSRMWQTKLETICCRKKERIEEPTH